MRGKCCKSPVKVLMKWFNEIMMKQFYLSHDWMAFWKRSLKKFTKKNSMQSILAINNLCSFKEKFHRSKVHPSVVRTKRPSWCLSTWHRCGIQPGPSLVWLTNRARSVSVEPCLCTGRCRSKATSVCSNPGRTQRQQFWCVATWAGQIEEEFGNAAFCFHATPAENKTQIFTDQTSGSNQTQTLIFLN